MIAIKQINLDLIAKTSPTKTIRQHTDDLLAALETIKQLGLIDDDKIYQLTKLACEYHDYGKINHQFQERLQNGKKFNPNQEIGHNLLSAPLVDKANFISDEDYAIVLNAIINHHRYINNIRFLQENRELIYEKLQDLPYSKVKSSILKKMIDLRETPLAIFVQGLLLRCDYSASANLKIELANDFLLASLDDLFASWQAQKQSIDLNAMQKFCRDHSGQNLIITAPTGMGKTEASLLWLANHKGFYVLPLKTAINSMYLRIKNDILKNTDIDQKLALLHSDSLAMILQNQQIAELDIFDYYNLSKRFSLPITICTPDQIFDFIFKYKGYELKLATLAYSKIIIDEIQAYNAELLSYIIYAIHQIIKMGGQIAIFTATLPPYILTLLENSYPNSPFIKADFSSRQSLIRHNVKIIDSEIKTNFIYDIFIANQSKTSNKNLIVCNTVKNAQAIYSFLAEKLGAEMVKLLHAKFSKNDRTIKEEQILSDGKSDIQKSVIWVTTQIVEASLDIDFDYIFTELSELSGLFQRLGRCNRKGLKPADNYNCYIFTQINPRLLISKYDSNKGFIDKDIYDLSRQALQNIDGILTESMKTSLLESVFTYDNLKDSVFIKEFSNKYKYVSDLFVDDTDFADIDRRFRRIISKTIMPYQLFCENESIIRQATETLNTTSKNGNWQQMIINKQKAKATVAGFCVNINHFDSHKNDLITTISLDKFNKIEVIDCFYDFNLGFVKNKQEGISSEDDGGIFI